VETYITQWLIGRHGHHIQNEPTKPPEPPRRHDRINVGTARHPGAVQNLPQDYEEHRPTGR
jgi:hypothetical protein